MRYYQLLLPAIANMVIDFAYSVQEIQDCESCFTVGKICGEAGILFPNDKLEECNPVNKYTKLLCKMSSESIQWSCNAFLAIYDCQSCRRNDILAIECVSEDGLTSFESIHKGCVVERNSTVSSSTTSAEPYEDRALAAEDLPSAVDIGSNTPSTMKTTTASVPLSIESSAINESTRSNRSTENESVVLPIAGRQNTSADALLPVVAIDSGTSSTMSTTTESASAAPSTESNAVTESTRSTEGEIVIPAAATKNTITEAVLPIAIIHSDTASTMKTTTESASGAPLTESNAVTESTRPTENEIVIPVATMQNASTDALLPIVILDADTSSTTETTILPQQDSTLPTQTFSTSTSDVASSGTEPTSTVPASNSTPAPSARGEDTDQIRREESTTETITITAPSTSRTTTTVTSALPSTSTRSTRGILRGRRISKTPQSNRAHATTPVRRRTIHIHDEEAFDEDVDYAAIDDASSRKKGGFFGMNKLTLAVGFVVAITVIAVVCASVTVYLIRRRRLKPQPSPPPPPEPSLSAGTESSTVTAPAPRRIPTVRRKPATSAPRSMEE